MKVRMVGKNLQFTIYFDVDNNRGCLFTEMFYTLTQRLQECVGTIVLLQLLSSTELSTSRVGLRLGGLNGTFHLFYNLFIHKRGNLMHRKYSRSQSLSQYQRRAANVNLQLCLDSGAEAIKASGGCSFQRTRPSWLAWTAKAELN